MDKRRADAKAKLKKSSSILKKPESKPDIKAEGKLAKSVAVLTNVFDQFKKTNVPIKKADLRKVVEASTKLKKTLPLDALIALNTQGNRRNVSQVIDYIEPRIFNFWQSQNMVPVQSDPLFKVKVLNLCVKVKKGKLRFDDNAVSKTGQFNDYLSLVEGCKLYIWNVKVNECASYNTLAAATQKEKYSKVFERICNVAGAPIAAPVLTDKEKEEESEDSAKGEGSEGGSSGEGGGGGGGGEGSSEGGGEGSSDGKSSEGGEEKSTEGGEGKSSEGGEGKSSEGGEGKSSEGGESSNPSEKTGAETTEGFIQDNIDSDKKLSNSDYIYIICTVLFIISLFFIYIRYRK